MNQFSENRLQITQLLFFDFCYYPLFRSIITAFHSAISVCNEDDNLDCLEMFDYMLKKYPQDINTRNEKGNLRAELETLCFTAIL